MVTSKSTKQYYPTLVLALGLVGLLAQPGFSQSPAVTASIIHGKDGKEMLLVPAGTFVMGSSEEEAEAAYHLGKKYYVDSEEASTERWWLNNELPRRQVWVEAFYMDKYEVTVGEYQTFVDSAGHRTLPADLATYAPGNNHPVVRVSWGDAAAYCQWAEKRLPTEAEWEKAARGEDGRLYPWGNSAPAGTLANYCDTTCAEAWKDAQENDGYAYTAPVGTYEAGKSPYGIYDLAGNVAEWVEDWYETVYYRHAPQRNPVNTTVSSFRVLRGGSWYLWPVHARAAHRSRFSPQSRLNNVGFRCALTASASTP